jgi:predicted nucleotide-binding protein
MTLRTFRAVVNKVHRQKLKNSAKCNVGKRIRMAKIKDLIERAERLHDSKITEPAFKSWRNDSIRFLQKVFGEESNEAATFENIKFSITYLSFDFFRFSWKENILKEKEIFEKGLKNAIFYLKSYESDILHDVDIEERGRKDSDKAINKTSHKKNIFIVHGHNDSIKDKVANFISKLGIEPIILNKQTNRGQTLLEKFEEYSDIKTAIIIFTNEDMGNYNDGSEYEKRAGQNMIFEAGYFLGKLGKKNTIVIAEQGVMLPSVLEGYTYFKMDREDKWKTDIAKKLKSMKRFNIDISDLN